MAENDREQAIEVHESALAEMTNEQLAEVQARVKQLVGEDESFNLCMAVMIASQQLYALARYSLQRECNKEGISWEDGVEELMIKAAKEHSLQPIARTDVLEKVQRTVLKFLTEEVDMQVQDERAEHMRATAEAHDIRMKTQVQITMPNTTAPKIWEVNDEPGYYTVPPAPVQGSNSGFLADRGDAIVVSGGLEAVEEAVSSVARQNEYTTMQLVGTTLRDKLVKKSQTHGSVRVGVNRWSGLAKSPSNFNRVLEPYLKRLHEHLCDIVLVTNLPLLGTEGVAGRSRVRTAEDALHVLRKWAKEQGAVVVAGLPRLGEDAGEWAEEVKKLLGEHHMIVSV